MFENFLFYFYFSSNVLGEKSVFYATEKKMMKKKGRDKFCDENNFSSLLGLSKAVN